ncbi:Putative Zinc finger, RING-type [Colletotrichum destructivum]|uniref:Zinc finger, RING-type n=1 Tax=Colletotrichum destructivum TaxID=34406 RepID=A0AAX4IXQ9_9PEZI|nr:Putative Zinc finger, RING-type [Colletotrichum destructivum]
MAAANEASSPPTATEPRTPTSTPQSPGTVTPAHQCRICRASFCQPLGCGHVYCVECLGPRHNAAPGKAGCPECDRNNPTPPRTVTPEPKAEPEFDYRRVRTVRQIQHTHGMVKVLFLLNLLSLAFLIAIGIVFAVIVSRLVDTGSSLAEQLQMGPVGNSPLSPAKHW